MFSWVLGAGRRRGHARASMLSGVILLMLIAAPIVSAGWITINTDDGLVDSQWGTPVYTSTCSNGSLADGLEIRNAWRVNDGTALYFRIETCGTATSYTNIRLGAGIDCNNDGDVVDPISGGGATGDRKAIFWISADQVWLVDGANNQVIQMPDNSYSERITTNFEWRLPLSYLYPACRGSTSPIGLALATVQISGGTPQTKDQTALTPWNIPLDYGDATNPDPVAQTCLNYPTRLDCGGPRHGLGSALRLGAAVDADGGGAQNIDATADDLDGTVDDEDGVEPTAGVGWTAGGAGSLTIAVSGGSGYVNCWIDWNKNNSWTDAGEQVVTEAALAAGAAVQSINVPAGVSFPNTFTSRCRLAPGAGQANTPTGPAEFGEVEDTQWAFGATGNRPAPVTAAISHATGSSDVVLSWNNLAVDESYLVLSSPRPHFLPGEGDVTTRTDPNNASPFTDAGVAGSAADANVYYAIQGQVTTSTPDLLSVPSNRVGLFEFGLVKGSG